MWDISSISHYSSILEIAWIGFCYYLVYNLYFESPTKSNFLCKNHLLHFLQRFVTISLFAALLSKRVSLRPRVVTVVMIVGMGVTKPIAVSTFMSFHLFNNIFKLLNFSTHGCIRRSNMLFRKMSIKLAYSSISWKLVYLFASFFSFIIQTHIRLRAVRESFISTSFHFIFT